jgi:hypothetical protein
VPVTVDQLERVGKSWFAEVGNSWSRANSGRWSHVTPRSINRRRSSPRKYKLLSLKSTTSQVVALNSGSKEMGAMALFEVMETGLELLCWRHLRVFPGDAVRLFNSGMNKELQERLRRLYDSR